MKKAAENKVYTVRKVKGNKVYLNEVPFKFYYTTDKTIKEYSVVKIDNRGYAYKVPSYEILK
jgi:hypothetical protein